MKIGQYLEQNLEHTCREHTRW